MSDHSEVDVARISQLFQRLGAGGEQADTMARQLLRRARQISVEQDISEIEATETLLKKVIEARQGG